MNNQTRSLLASASPRIQSALQDYLDRVDKGEQIDADAFLIRHAEIADELRSFIAVDQQARQLAGAATPKTGSPGPEKIEGKAPQTKAEVSTHSVVGNIGGTVGGKPKTPDVAAPVVSVARSPADLPVVFGRYRVQKKLGSGAMGAVYLADDTLLDRRVALKTPTFENDQEGELLRRFYREARAVANLKHPNLCAVYDVGEIDGRHYISMEFVRGKKLQDYIKPDRPMAEKQVMAVIRKIALAMHEAHSHGVIHRDLKPDNIMVNEKGEPVVMDFGLVYKSESKNSTRITQRGMLVGSPAYMSKEQVEGDPDKLTAATDQYSLGVILYQLLTAKLPFDGGIHGVLAAILTKDPTPPGQLRSDVNPHLEAICLKMMAKEAKDRYPSMKAVADVILEVSKGTSRAAGFVVVAEPAAQSLTDGLTATFAGASLAEPVSLPELKVKDSFIKSRIRRATQKGSNRLLYSCLAAGLFLLLSVIFWIRSGQALVKVEVLADDVQVTFDNETLSLIESGSEYRVTPGEHTLHIKSKDTEFDTAKFTLKRGENPVVVVEVVVSEIVARFGNDVIAGHPANIPAAAQGEEKEATSQIHSGSPQEQPDFNGMRAGETRIIAGQRYVWCPPGTFRMGSDTHETERRNHGNPVEVRMTNGFWLSELETTQRQFQEVMNKAPWKGQLYAKDSPNLAASYIDHYDATEFCVKKSQIEHDASRLPVSWHFALPTEAQWEYACRAGTTTAFSFGDVEEQLVDYAWFGISRDAPLNAFAHEGGRKKPNQWGIYDMSGNVWEWCSDWYAEELVGGRDPIGPQSGTLRILRGGSWQDGSRCGRVGLRNRYSASDRVDTIGFRVAIVPRTVTTNRALNDPGPNPSSDGGIRQEQIDLLAVVDVSQLGDSDMKWERKGQTVVCTGTGAAGKSAWKGFRFPTEIGGDYEVELEFQQRAFWPMQIDFPLQDKAVRVSLTGDFSDLMIEDDKAQPNAERTWRSSAAKLKTMVPQKLVIRVRQSGSRADIEATLDGVTLGTYSGERSRIAFPAWVKPNFKQITSGSLCGNLAEGYIELRRAVYRPLSRASRETAGTSMPAVRSSFRHGVKAEIFEGKNFDKKVSERLEPTLECLWDWGAPAREAPVDQFSIRFSGWLRAPKSGLYKIGSWNDDGVRVSINGKMVIDRWQLKKAYTEAAVQLTEEPQSIVVEAFDHDADSWMTIFWQGPGETALSPIPSEALYPDEASARASQKDQPPCPHGLTADYFDKSFTTKLATQRVYQAHSIWYTGAPLPGLPTQACVRYTGVLVPPVSGEFKLVSAARTGMKVWIDSGLVMDASFPLKKIPIRLEANMPYSLKIEHINLDGEGSYYLHWIPPGESREVPIPPACLFPNRESVTEANTASMQADAAPLIAGQEEGWTDLFTGRDLTGWTPMLTTGANDEIQSPTTVGWSVRGREIICETKAPGWLRLDRSYGECEFEFEFFMPPNSNSGLLVRYGGQGSLNNDNKCEVQLLNLSETQSLDAACGAIHRVVPAVRNNFRPGRWNGMTIRIAEERLIVRLNDETVVDVGLNDHAALRRLPDTGNFGLYNWRGEADGCRFRNIRVKDLTKTIAAIPKASAGSAPTSPMPDPGTDEVATSGWIDLLEWSEGIDWKSRGYDWNENCEGTPGKAGITLKPTKGLQNIVPLPAIIEGDYDMEVEFTRHEGHHSVEVFFPVNSKNIHLLLGASSDKVEGMLGVDGKSLLAENNGEPRNAFAITNNKRHRISIRVRRTEPLVRLEVDLDNNQNHFTWSGHQSELDKVFGGRKLTTIRRPWIAAYESRVTFEKVRVRMLSGTIQTDFITQADRDADLAEGFVRLVGEPAIKPIVGFSKFCVNQIPMEVANGPESTWPLIIRDFAPCRDFYGAHAPSRLKCPVPKGAKSFTVVGYNDGSRSTKYILYVDGKEIYASGLTGIIPIQIDLPRDAGLLELLVETGGNSNFDCSYWCYPRFHDVASEKVTDKMLTDRQRDLKFEIQSHTVGADKLTYNQPFTFCSSVPLEYRDAKPCDEFLYSVPNASVTYAVPDGMTRFTAIGYCVVSHLVRFEVWADAKQIFASPQVGIIPIDVKLPSDTKTVELKINDLGNSEYDNAMWCYPRLHRK